MTIPFSFAFYTQITEGPIAKCVTGGTYLKSPNGKEMRIFTSDGTFSNGCGEDITVDVIVVAGGGGGGDTSGSGTPIGGGGGAGGVVIAEDIVVKDGEDIPVHVGSGGAEATDGEDSVFWVDPTGVALDPSTDPQPSATSSTGGGAGGSGGDGAGSGGGSGGGGGSGCDINEPGAPGGSGTGTEGNDGGAGTGKGGSSTCGRGAAGGGGSYVEAGTGGIEKSSAQWRGGPGGAFIDLPGWGIRLGGGGSGAMKQESSAGPCDTWDGAVNLGGKDGEGYGAGGGGSGNPGSGGAGSDGIVAVQIQGAVVTTDYPDATIARTTEGLVIRDQFTASDQDLDDYSTWVESDPGAYEIVSNQVEISGATVTKWGVISQGDQGVDVIAQINAVKRTNTSGYATGEVLINADGADDDQGYIFGAGGQFNQYVLYKAGSGLSGAGTSPAKDSWTTIRLVMREGDSGRYILEGLSAEGITDGEDLSNDLTSRVSHTDAGTRPTGGYYGIRTLKGDQEIDEFIVCGLFITISGLPSGWSAQIDSRTSEESDGNDVYFDPSTWALPATTVKIFDPDGTQKDSVSPGNGVWGGDVYTVTVEDADA